MESPLLVAAIMFASIDHVIMAPFVPNCYGLKINDGEDTSQIDIPVRLFGAKRFAKN